MNQSLTAETLEQLCSDTPLGRLGTPEDVAEAILFLCKADSFFTGQVLSPNGGLVI